MRVFISYSSRDYRQADWLRSELKKSSIECWMAPESIPGGRNYADHIPMAIRTSDAFIVLLSAASMESYWVQNEIGYAVNYKKPLIPIHLDKSTLTEAFRFILVSSQIIETGGRIEKSMDEIREALRDIDQQSNITPDREIAGEPGQEFVFRSIYDFEQGAEKKEDKKQTGKKQTGKKPYIFIALLCALVLAGVAFAFGIKNLPESEKQIESAAAQDHEIEWNDPVLEEKMRKITGIETGSIMLSDVQDLEVLHLENPEDEVLTDSKKIKDISALKELSGVKELYLGNNRISDISALSEMTDLKILYLGDNQVSNISYLSNLTNLQELMLNGNYVSDLSAIKNLEQLQILYLNCNKITDIGPLKNLNNLSALVMNENGISDIKALSGLTSLTGLYMFGNQLKDISPLRELTNLEELELADNHINDISALSGMVHLTYLNISGNNIDDYSPIENLNIEEVYTE